MRHVCVTVLAIAALLGAPGSRAWFADPDREIGDALQFAPSAFALGLALQRADTQGQQQWLYSTLTTVATAEALKHALNGTAWGTRPNGGPYSFPSGHTAMACSGSGFLWDRYGAWYGAPAFAVAGYVAYSRVIHDEHRWRDIVAGCTLAVGIDAIFVTPQGSADVSLQPGAAGLTLAMRWRWR